MNAPLLVAVRTEVSRTTTPRSDGGETEMLTAPWHAMPIPGADTPERAPVDRLLRGAASPGELDLLAAAAGTTGLARWMLWATRSRDRGLLCYRLQTSSGRWVADLIPTSHRAPDFMLSPPAAPPAARFQLSRFAVLHRGPRGMILESPLATMRAELSAAAAAAVTAFSVPGGADRANDDQTSRSTPALGAAEGRTLLAALLAAKIVGPVGDDDLLTEEHDPLLSQWEFQDLLLHTRSRTVRPDEARGGTYRFAHVRAAPPALKHSAVVGGEQSATRQIALERPDLALLIAEDPPLARVMEERSSRRRLGPLTARQLGEFLYRTMRVRGVGSVVEQALHHPTASRPYPSAGGLYELTAYLAIDACEGIPRGLYRYDPVQHGLQLVASPGADVDRLLREAGRAGAMTTRPPVLVILVADFRRLSWKYEGIAYALTLKDVGVLYQSMQLAATAMGLGSCPLGAGDSELFARTAGTNSLEESSVGEFLLGS